jgi:hypothetical protein
VRWIVDQYLQSVEQNAQEARAGRRVGVSTEKEAEKKRSAA